MRKQKQAGKPMPERILAKMPDRRREFRPNENLAKSWSNFSSSFLFAEQNLLLSDYSISLSAAAKGNLGCQSRIFYCLFLICVSVNDRILAIFSVKTSFFS
jgi:hypothetical protein